jgi:hypothetical protein
MTSECSTCWFIKKSGLRDAYCVPRSRFDRYTAEVMPAHHFADRVSAAARDELQLRNERGAEAIVPRQTRELPQFANRPGNVARPSSNVVSVEIR